MLGAHCWPSSRRLLRLVIHSTAPLASLFDTLLRLQSRHTDRTPLEDYFTELFAYLLQDAPDILDAFLARFKLTQLPGPVLASVRTQVSYDRLEAHDMDSRPDWYLSNRRWARMRG
jgi:hypothetical protein